MLWQQGLELMQIIVPWGFFVCLVGFFFLFLFTLKTIVQSSVFTLEEEQTSVLFDVCTS